MDDAQATQFSTFGGQSFVTPSEQAAILILAFFVRVRIPGWVRGIENPYGLYVSDGARRWSMTLGGETVEPLVENGYAVLERDWSPGDTVVVHLDVSERIVRARTEVVDVAGLVARMRGPVLMARENGRVMPYYDVANNGPASHEVWTAV